MQNGLLIINYNLIYPKEKNSLIMSITVHYVR